MKMKLEKIQGDSELSNDEKRALMLEIYRHYQDTNIENLKKTVDEIGWAYDFADKRIKDGMSAQKKDHNE